MPVGPHSATSPSALLEDAGRTSTAARVRWWAALLIMTGPALYATVRTIVVRMASSRPEWDTTLLLIGSLLAAMLLTWRLKPRLPERWGARTRPLMLILWCVCCGLGVAFASDRNLPRILVSGLFILGTLWVPWICWLGFDSVRPARRVGQLLAVFTGLAVLASSLKVVGMQGDNTVDFRWRWSSARDFEIPAPQPQTGAVSADFEASPNDFPGYFGPARDGVIASPEPRATDWNTNPPRELWRRPVGAGWSGFAVRGDSAVTQEQRGDDEYVVCYRISDGEILWSVKNAGRFESPMGGPGPRATPSIAPDGRIYTVGGAGWLQCIDGTSGRVEWSLNILEDNSGANLAHGVCGSPLIDGRQVIVAPTGNPKVCLASYDRLTGSRLWQAGRHAASYSSPTIVELAGRRQLLLHAAQALEAHDPETGEFLWEFEWSNSYDNNCSQPIVVDAAAGRLIVTSGYGTGAALIEVTPDGGTWSVRTIWTSRAMSTKLTSAIRIGDSLYGLDDKILACLDVATGKRRWKSGRYNHGQILLVDSVLLVQAENGDLALVDPRPDEFVELARIPMLNNKTWNNPAVAGRYILVRNAEEAVCLEWPATFSSSP